MPFDKRLLQKAVNESVAKQWRATLANQLTGEEFSKVTVVTTETGVSIQAEDNAIMKKAREALGLPAEQEEPKKSDGEAS